MSASRVTKVKRKGTVRELKVVDSVNRRGSDVFKLEEVKTPRKNSASTSQHNLNLSSSPIKRPKLEAFEAEPFVSDLDDTGTSKKRQTLVFLFHHNQKQSLKTCRAKMTI